MKCSIQGCPGSYEARAVVHTVRRRGEVMVIDHVPAEVCAACGDVLLAPETVRRLEALLDASPPPDRNVPLYEFAWPAPGRSAARRRQKAVSSRQSAASRGQVAAFGVKSRELSAQS